VIGVGGGSTSTRWESRRVLPGPSRGVLDAAARTEAAKAKEAAESNSRAERDERNAARVTAREAQM
jgi:hypothetical protein